MGTLSIGGKELTPQEVVAQAEKAPGTLLAIVGFSVVNSVLALFGVDIMFVIGLGSTFLVDAMLFLGREEFEGTVMLVATAIGLAINGCILGVFVLLWWLSRRGSRLAYVIACLLYLLDGGVCLLLQIWMGVVFHGIFLFVLFGGYNFVKRRAMAEAMLLEAEAAAALDGGPEGISAPDHAVGGVSQPDADAAETWAYFEKLWQSLPSYSAQASASHDPEGSESLYAVLARLGFSQSGAAAQWNGEHLRIVHQHLMNCERAGDGEQVKQFHALALGVLLGMHAAGRLDDAGYGRGGQVLAEFAASRGDALEPGTA